MSYKLFSATHRCMPCQILVRELDLIFPEWRSCVEYIDADNMTEGQRELASSLGVMRLPTFTNEKEIINLNQKDFTINNSREKARKIKELCTTKE